MSSDEDVETLLSTARSTSVPVRAARLRVERGPDAGKEAAVDAPTLTVGTASSCDFVLSDPSVSKSHLRIGVDAFGVRIRDDGSKNGTFLSGVRVHDVQIAGDVVLDLGNTQLRISVDTAPREIRVSTQASFGAAIGRSLAMRHVFEMLERAARSDICVLLEGESGVGKEVLAREVHNHSDRSRGPFVVLDCGATPPALIESDLFGHERGAFTGANEARRGVFELAHRGTLFLDEIGELDVAMQPKLLRALESREVRPVGADAFRKVDVRIVAATNRDLTELVKAGQFRADLFYRLAVARTHIPPLRDRHDDILPLATTMLRATIGDERAELPPDFAALLTGYTWPGNVRELRNVVQRYALLGSREPRVLFDGVERSLAAPSEDLSLLPYEEARQRAIGAFEAIYFPAILARAGGVMSKAAEHAGVARASFYKMMRRVTGPSLPPPPPPSFPLVQKGRTGR